jgi:UDP-2,3-diacylglucosamine pyrophosphatase LpxH
MVFISDLHMGVGRLADGKWDPKEDFRWPKALEGLLDKISREGNHKNNVDLIIAGDFLELWQPPANIKCTGPTPDLGCTVEQMKNITLGVVSAHPDVFATLRHFAQRGNNRIYVIPGNHDSALLIPSVWQPVAQALGADKGRVELVTSGIWASADRRVVVEHGHQIGSDVNRYETWPVVYKRLNGTEYIIRPWGELFVQKLFNDEESEYPIIDNLSPETAGARYRMSDRGLWRSAHDVARFIAFNLWETSLNQKGKFLGRKQDDKGRPIWDLRIARGLGHKLVAGALDSDDPFRKEMLSDNDQSRKLREELDALVQDPSRLNDDQVRLLCDLVAIQKSDETCDDPTLGYTLEKLLVPREWIIRGHLDKRLEEFERMSVFIYGHTHKYEKMWPIRVNSLSVVNVLNTGAFQRLIDDEQFIALVKSKTTDPSKAIDPSEGLRTISVDDLPSCYTVVIIKYKDGLPEPKLKRWYMPEDGNGKLLEPGEQECS